MNCNKQINNFDIIRNDLIEEANTSPNMLSDIAGLETYISESYNNRSFIELLQNADDALSTKFLIIRVGKYLLIANNGREFTEEDLISLCRSASSKKERGSSIGYRGIGFKSVVNIAQEVHIISGDLQITFSRELTKKVVTSASKVPLIRIPHNIDKDVLQQVQDVISNYKNLKYTTFFIFSGILIEQIEDEYKDINSSSLLFLHNITEVDNQLANNYIKINKEAYNDLGIRIKIINNDKLLSEWLLHSYNNINIAFSIKSNEIKRLERNEALLYAFLPTEDITGLGVLINADFSTDPSRRHIINDVASIDKIQLVCEAYKNIFLQYISDNSNYAKSIINALAPYSEPSFVQFAGSQFEKLFFTQIKNTLQIDYFLFKPQWLNNQDFINISNVMQIENISNSDVYNTIPSLLKYLGAKELSLKDISKKDIINNIDITVLGASQIASKIIKNEILTNDSFNLDELSLFYKDSHRTNLKEINSCVNSSIDESFLNTLIENGISNDDIIRILKKYNLNNILSKYTCSNKIEDTNNNIVLNQCDIPLNVENPIQENYFEKNTINNKQTENNIPNINQNSLSIQEWYNKTLTPSENISNPLVTTKMWRNTEQQVLDALNNNGFILEDVSTQNLGYDLEGTDPNGKKIFIEVKSISTYGQSFKMTNNEYAVAQIKADSFIIAIAYINNNILYLDLYRNPVNTLRLNRQCVQWAWECKEYTYKPQSFKL